MTSICFTSLKVIQEMELIIQRQPNSLFPHFQRVWQEKWVPAINMYAEKVFKDSATTHSMFFLSNLYSCIELCANPNDILFHMRGHAGKCYVHELLSIVLMSNM